MFHFRPEEIRILGCLIEKRFSTPDSYPLTLNSLVLACNQSSNRDPVMELDSLTVDGALKSTRIQGYSILFTGADSRVPKFKENLCEKLNLSRPQAAVMAELMVRGPQTPGELRQRCSRMFEFPDLRGVEAVLESLREREEALVAPLPQQPGKREIRWAHLLSGEIDGPAPGAPVSHPLEQRVADLERQVAEILARLEGL